MCKFEETPWNIFQTPLILQTIFGVSGITKCKSLNLALFTIIILYSTFCILALSYIFVNQIILTISTNMFVLPTSSYRCVNYLGCIAITFKNLYRPNDTTNFKCISKDIFAVYKELYSYKNLCLRKYFVFNTAFTFWIFFNMLISFYKSYSLFGPTGHFQMDLQVFGSTCVIECEILMFSTLMLILSDCMEKVTRVLIPKTESKTVLIDKGSIEQMRSFPTTVEHIGSFNDLVNINKASEKYIRIFEIVERLRNYFQLQIFLYLKCVFWHEILSLIVETVIGLKQGIPFDFSVSHNAQVFMYFGRMFVILILLCASCQRLKCKVHDLKVALISVAVRTKDKETRRRVRAVIRAITQQSTDITVYGMFQVDLSFVVRYFGIITTYLVVTLQFFL